jgi:DNA polymerase-1
VQGKGRLADLARETVDLWGKDPKAPFPQVISWMMEMGHDKAIELKKAWKEVRKQAKAVNFGFLYSMGAKKFTEYAKVQYGWDVTIEEASQIREAFFSTYASLPGWHERQKSLVRIDGYVRNIMGRKRRLPGIWSPDKSMAAECERLSINAPVQGAIGDLKVMGMLSIYHNLQVPDNGARIRIRGEVHDSILMWVKTEHLDEILPRVKHYMEHPELLDLWGIVIPIPIVADIEIGTWGAGRTWKGGKYNG